MKAVLQNVKVGDVTVQEIPTPLLKKQSVRVRNLASLVSAGTEKSVMDFSSANYLKKARLRPDLFRKVLNKAKNDGLLQTYKVVSNLIDQEIQLGYSTAGIVEAVGDEVLDIQVGQRVACAGLFAATHSEVVSIPRNLLVPVPDNVGMDEASFVTLGAISLQGVRLADVTLSENVVIYGLGLVGMLTAQLCVAAGARVIGVDVVPDKLAMAEKFGCIPVLADKDLEKNILGLTDGYGADTVMLCAATKSNEPIERIPEITRQKGLLVVVGDVPMNIPRREYYNKEIDIRISRSYGPGRYDLSYEEGGTDYPFAYVRWTENRNMQAIMDLLSRRKLDIQSLISHRFDIGEATRGYDLIQNGTEPYLGIVLTYGSEESTPAVQREVNLKVQETPPGNVNFGVIGAGNFGKAFLLPNFAKCPNVSFDTAATASGVSATNVAKKYNMRLATSEPDSIFDNDKINAVIIATRHDSHAQYVSHALQTNKAVFVEKPLATTIPDLEGIRETYLAEQAKGNNPYLMVGFNRRFSPLAVAFKEVLSRTADPISLVYRVNAGPVPKGEWVHDRQIGAGRVIGEICHFIDFLTFVTGALPTTLSATVMKNGDSVVDDVVSVTLGFANGSVGTIHYFANGDSSMPKEYVEGFSSGVSAQLINFRKLKTYGAKARGKTSYLNQVKGFEQETQVFVKNLLAGKDAPIPFEELWTTSLATLLVERAATSGGRVSIALP